MLAQVLREGFALAHRRPGLILLDMLWKGIWLAFTLGGLLLAGYWFAAQTEWPAADIRLLDAAVAARLWNQLWSDYGSQVFAGFLGVLGFSLLLWLILESVVRRRIIWGLLVGAGFTPAFKIKTKIFFWNLNAGVKPAPTNVFLASSLLKLVILVGVALILGVIALRSDTWDGVIAGLVIFASIAFFLTLLDTLLRIDAIELLGTDLITITGLVGILLLFEALIGGSLAIAVIAGFLNVSRPSEALAMIGVTTLVLLFFNFLHSYLLVVRFSAVGIMRRNAVEV